MTNSSPSVSLRRRKTRLAILLAAIATAVVIVVSLVSPRSGTDPGEAAAATPAGVSVFGENATPRTSPTDEETVGTVALSAATSAAAATGAFPEDTTPQNPVDPDRASVELGLRFTPRVDGTVAGIRFFRTPANAGPHVGTLWSGTGEVLARVSFPDSSTTGWHTAEISPAIAVTAGTPYVVSYLAPSGRYAADEHGFDVGSDTDVLDIPRGAGVFAYGAGVFPTENHRNSNYYVDVSFVPGGDPTDPEETPEPQPTATSGALPEDLEPEQDADPDRSTVEVGMRFTPKQDGTVTALRFYRFDDNPGPHRGTLWNADGTVLARAEFPAEGEAGWQTVELEESVAVRAGAEYVVSYLARQGRYASDEHYFDSGVENEYFSVPVGAGVYAYGSNTFPAQTYNNSNYYVDVRFAPAATPPPGEPTASPSPSTPAPQPSPSTSPSATPTPSPSATAPDGTSVLDLPTEPWWGGPQYYAQWDKAEAAGWTDPSFFPISVFFGKPSQTARLAAMGINTFMGAEHDGSRVSAITRHGVSLIAQDEWTSAEVGSDPGVVGWHVSDECEMGLGGCASTGEEGSLEIQKRFVADLRAKDDGRFLQANFGNGVLGTYWSPETMDDHLALMDVTSVDKYAYTSPHVQDLFRGSPFWPDGRDPASSGAYGWQQDRMEGYMSPVASQPNWVFVETAKPYLIEAGATTITVEQIRGAVWNAIIHGAAGIAYFQHNNNGCGNYSLIDCGAQLQEGVGAVNQQVADLAPVINTPSYSWTFGEGLETALKAHDGSAYIMAMTDGGTGERTFTLPGGLTGPIEVVGEDRTLTATDGVFSDGFAAENTVHIYRVEIG
ncbi:DUF4082 domain-containing protein [Microbacterium sp. dk485]|uniref:DUF4082 domain-containing protein n=1 Tax=Microbacterium sp. dk485 TaxID=2560021 RepID=UPI0010737AD7|nr:DUF4082 domain-containing protein [Microbacterium sp. dk485]TFV84072.1 DUF4082 domain-containing protein [Microbacterium sp. dk485]